MTQEQLFNLELAITQCDSQDEFEELVQRNASWFGNDWAEYIRPLMVDRRLRFDEIAAGCGISYNTARSFAKTVPTKRINVIFLAMMLGLTVDETNHLLIHRAKYHRLYAKNPADVICIYLLVNGGSSEPQKMYDAYLNQYRTMMRHYEIPQSIGSYDDTEIVQQFVLEQAGQATVDAVNDRDFYLMMQRLIPGFSGAYRKLLDFIDHHFIYPESEAALSDCYGVSAPRKREPHAVSRSDKRMTPNERFQEDADYRDIFYKNIRKIRDQHEIPSRSFLITLGARLNMDVSQINEMLHLAGMGPLYANDRIEAAVVFVLEELCCQIPTYFNRPKKLATDPVFSELQVFSVADEIARLRRNGLSAELSAESWLQLDEVSELPPEHLNDYLKRKLEEMRIFDGKDDRKALEKFLGLL